MASTVVESGQAIVAGHACIFANVLTKDGKAYDLTGKTVKATIRERGAPTTVVDATLEDIAVTVSEAAAGRVTFSLTSAMSALLAPPAGQAADAPHPFLVQYKVQTDNFYPRALGFGVLVRMD